jgi:hypothetical protein
MLQNEQAVSEPMADSPCRKIETAVSRPRHEVLYGIVNKAGFTNLDVLRNYGLKCIALVELTREIQNLL